MERRNDLHDIISAYPPRSFAKANRASLRQRLQALSIAQTICFGGYRPARTSFQPPSIAAHIVRAIDNTCKRCRNDARFALAKDRGGWAEGIANAYDRSICTYV